jgi:hypothetical protein
MEPLSAEFLREKTLLARDHIHRKNFASDEEVHDFLKIIQEDISIRNNIHQTILSAAHAGKNEAHIRFEVPARILRVLGVHSSTFQMHEPYLVRFTGFLKRIADVQIVSFNPRGLDGTNAEPALWVWLRWDV